MSAEWPTDFMIGKAVEPQRGNGQTQGLMELDVRKPYTGETMTMEPFHRNEDPLTGKPMEAPTLRQFETGATRNNDEGKPDYEGYLSPLVLEAFGRYMLKHSKLENGERRASDNWQKGMPLSVYMKSGWRHFMDWWRIHRGGAGDLEEALCALLFNVAGYLHEHLKGKRPE